MSQTNRSTRLMMAGALGAVLVVGSASIVSAREGGSDTGDSVLRQEQQNPRFVEPYGYRDPATYRLGQPRAGYYARQRIEYGGDVYVRPYRPDYRY